MTENYEESSQGLSLIKVDDLFGTTKPNSKKNTTVTESAELGCIVHAVFPRTKKIRARQNYSRSFFYSNIRRKTQDDLSDSVSFETLKTCNPGYNFVRGCISETFVEFIQVTRHEVTVRGIRINLDYPALVRNKKQFLSCRSL